MWAFAVIAAAVIAAIFAFAGWIFAVPLGLLAIGSYLFARHIRSQSAAAEVSELRDQVPKAAPLDKGGIEFTDKDRESLSS